MKLYYISDFNDKNLLVYEDSPEMALIEWRKYYHKSDDEKPYGIFEIPLTPKRGALHWFDDARLVWWVHKEI